MAKRVETGQRASAHTSPSDQRPPVSQPPQPGTPFSVPQPNTDTLPQWGEHLQASQPPRPGTPFSVPQLNTDTLPQWGEHLQASQPPRPGTPFNVPPPDSNTLSQCGKHTTSRDLRDFVPLGLHRPTRSEFGCPKPYDDQKFQKPDAYVTEELQKLKACIMASANKRTLGPLRDLKEKKKWTVPLPLRVPEGMSNPLTRDTRPSVLQPATRKRVASTSVPIPGKVKRSRPMSTGFEEPMDDDQLGTRVPATSTKHSTRDASEKFRDHTVPGPSSADFSVGQRGQVISPHIQVSLHPSLTKQGDLGSSTSPQDVQRLSLSPQDVLEQTKRLQESVGHSTSVQASQRPHTCPERKIIHVSSSRRSFKSLTPTVHVSNLSNSPPKHVGQGPSGQGDLQQGPSDKEGPKSSSPEGKISGVSNFPKVSSPTASPSDQRLLFSQPSRPGTPFSVPQPDSNTQLKDFCHF
ncbi:uncharacterized protein LOC116075399 [Mastomys coucha]|uniref:uncharacterized protein LOC116075399 n=1 Tax=Mastomys coucha TaxID=35658 RepID=UPI0012622D36|nr:uncharacterized protein LOC116075399 [Mastomys coucha]